MISQAASFAKAATVATAWLAPEPAQATAHDWGTSRGAAAFVRSAGASAPVQPQPAGVLLLRLGLLPEAPAVNAEANWHEAHQSFTGFRNLADDWDGEGAAAPLPGVVDGAALLALHLEGCGVAPPDLVHVGVNGTVYYEWRTEHGYAEVEVKSPVEAVVRWLPKNDTDTLVATLTRAA